MRATPVRAALISLERLSHGLGGSGRTAKCIVDVVAGEGVRMGANRARSGHLMRL